MPLYSPTDLEALVRQRAPEIAKEISRAASSARNEADLVAEVEKVIERFAKNFDVSLKPDRERTLINGRADAVYNRLVIEYEPAGSLRLSNTYGHNQHAIGQVKQYMEGLARLDRHKKERLAGVVLDGHFYIFVRYREGHWYVDDPLPVSAHSTETFLRYLLSLSTELALTPENLVRDFGENSNTARRVVPALYEALKETDNPKVGVLFKQWRRQFSEVTGYDASSGQLDALGLAKSYAVLDRKPDLEKLFFAIHTYYGSFIKLLAVQVAHYYLMPKLGTGLAAAANYETEKLQDYMMEMERGGLFAQLGIRNFLEGDFFGWYLEIWDENLDGAVRRLIGDLANYSLVTLDVDPEETRDLLKQLYQNLMPKKLRHALGEYYTPDWLAERLLNQLGYDGDPRKRLLDPACGSGTFLVLAIKRVRKYADEKMLSPDRVLNQVLENIVGFDLNPLAVISARTNYLLALGELLPYRRGDISIPVYIADSILTPSMEVSEGGQMSFIDLRAAEGDGKVRPAGYRFNTSVGRFTVPGSLVSAHYIDQFADLLEECVHNGLAAEQFKARLLKTFPLHEASEEDGVGIAVELYEQLIELEKQGINGIWARIIKNAFAPLFQGRFDYVAGNPPWVNWESLPGDYRLETKSLWQYYGLYHYEGLETVLGTAKKDVSMLMTYVALDNYLADKGKLGFVITQTVFKTSGAGEGFRRFRLPNGTPIEVVHVDDMAKLKPFEGAANRTAIVVMRKGRTTSYPVSYFYWFKPGGGSVIREDLTLNEVMQDGLVQYKEFAARPIDTEKLGSSWITGYKGAIRALGEVLGRASYKAHAGAYTSANGVYWLEVIARRPDGLLVISNLTEGAKRKVANVQAAIEPNLVYPLLRGRDVSRWEAKPSAYQLLPHTRDTLWRPIEIEQMQQTYPKTFTYLKKFETELLERKTAWYQKVKDKLPFYIVFAIGDYTFAPYKVVWREQASRLTAAVTDHHEGRLVIPDHKLMIVGLEDQAAAHYLCACLNSSPSQFVVLSYGVSIQMDTHVLENVRIPLYEPNNRLHNQLSSLSQQAHGATTAEDVDGVKEIEAEIDKLAAKLWALTTAELKEIQESLAELG